MTIAFNVKALSPSSGAPLPGKLSGHHRVVRHRGRAEQAQFAREIVESLDLRTSDTRVVERSVTLDEPRDQRRLVGREQGGSRLCRQARIAG